MWKFLFISFIAASASHAEARSPRESTSSLSRGDVICDMTTGVATGVGSGTCVAHPVICNGDMASINRNLTTVDFRAIVSVSVDTFTSGDVGKTINLPGAASGGGILTAVISKVNSFTAGKQDIVLSKVARSNLSGVATNITYGTDDAQGFADFLTWANLVWQARNSGLIEQYIPPGKTCQLLSLVVLRATSFDPNCANALYGFSCLWNSSGWARGIKKFLMNFGGSTVINGPSGFFTLAQGDGVCHNGINSKKGCSARTDSASVGATSVTLLDTSLCSRFTVGNYAVMTGFSTQALYSASSSFGYPPNPAFYDYAIVTSTSSCASTGQVTLDRALTNDYKSTWPANAPGTTGEADQGGPATLYALPFWWDAEAEYRGGTFNNGSTQTNSQGRKTVLRDITWAGGVNCTYPSQSIDWIVIGGDWSICTIEMDKIVVNASFQHALVNRINHQSISPRYFTIANSNLNMLIGTPRNTNITDTHINSVGDLQLGSTGFGRSDSFNCTNCVIGSNLSFAGAQENGPVSNGVWSISGQSGGPYSATMTGGIITIPNVHGAVTWATPGTNVMWSYSGSERVYNYQVLDVTQDATNQYVKTTCVGANTVCGVRGAFPVASGGLRIAAHPAPKFNCTNCTGTPLWLAVSDGPIDAPLFSYQKYTADRTFQTTSKQFVRAWGKAISLVFTVNSPYAGVGALNFRPTRKDVYGVWDETNVSGSFVPSIDLKTGGTRTITGSGCTGCGGADSGTTLNFGASTWFAGSIAPSISSQPAWTGTIDITMTFDQGVVNP